MSRKRCKLRGNIVDTWEIISRIRGFLWYRNWWSNLDLEPRNDRYFALYHRITSQSL